MTDLLPFVADLPLVDHHCHGVVTKDVARADFEAMLTEADTTSPLGTSLFDSLIGLAVRERCAPVLDLPKHAPADAYLGRRAELGAAEVARRFLRATGTTDFLLDGGFRPDSLTTTPEFARAGRHPRARRRPAGAGRRRRHPGNDRRRFRRGLRRRAGETRRDRRRAQVDRGLPRRPRAGGGAAVAVGGRSRGGTLARRGRHPRSPTRSCTASWCSPASTWACPCSSTSVTATPTSTCTAATRCCSPGCCGRPATAACRSCCCTTTRSTATPRIWRRSSSTCSSTPGSSRTTRGSGRRPCWPSSWRSRRSGRCSSRPTRSAWPSCTTWARPCSGRDSRTSCVPALAADAMSEVDAVRLCALVGHENAKRIYRLEHV